MTSYRKLGRVSFHRNAMLKNMTLSLLKNGISTVINRQFNTNYTSFVNKFRIQEAMKLLKDKRKAHLTIEDVSDAVGFSTRQSFYTSFKRFTGMTPREYRISSESDR